MMIKKPVVYGFTRTNGSMQWFMNEDDRDRAAGLYHGVRLWEHELHEEVTNPAPELPTEAGSAIRDALNTVWVRQKDGHWRHGSMGAISTERDLLGASNRAPFTRLVAETPPVTAEQVAEVLEEWGIHLPDKDLVAELVRLSVADYVNGPRA